MVVEGCFTVFFEIKLLRIGGFIGFQWISPYSSKAARPLSNKKRQFFVESIIYSKSIEIMGKFRKDVLKQTRNDTSTSS